MISAAFCLVSATFNPANDSILQISLQPSSGLRKTRAFYNPRFETRRDFRRKEKGKVFVFPSFY